MLALAVFKLPASAEPYGGISVLKRDESRSSTANHQCDGERKWTAIYSANRSLINDKSAPESAPFATPISLVKGDIECGEIQ